MEAISSLLRTVKMAKKVPKDYFKAPQKVSDKKRRAVMVFMNRIFYACYFTQNKYLMVLLTSKMVRMTIKHGVTPTSGTAYVSCIMGSALLLDRMQPFFNIFILPLLLSTCIDFFGNNDHFSTERLENGHFLWGNSKLDSKI
jgi:hypothetical protein